MTDDLLTSASAIAEWLRTHMRKGDGLTRPTPVDGRTQDVPRRILSGPGMPTA
jgi:hypothetical protein